MAPPVESETQTGMCQQLTSTFEESCGCTVLDMPEQREMTEQIDWRAKQPSQKILSVEELEMLPAGTKPRALHYQGEERSLESGSAQLSSSKGPSSIRQTWEPFQKQHWESFCDRYHLEQSTPPPQTSPH